MTKWLWILLFLLLLSNWGVGLHVVYIIRYFIRIKKYLHNRIELIKIQSNHKEYELLQPLKSPAKCNKLCKITEHFPFIFKLRLAKGFSMTSTPKVPWILRKLNGRYFNSTVFGEQFLTLQNPKRKNKNLAATLTATYMVRMKFSIAELCLHVSVEVVNKRTKFSFEIVGMSLSYMFYSAVQKKQFKKSPTLERTSFYE